MSRVGHLTGLLGALAVCASACHWIEAHDPPLPVNANTTRVCWDGTVCPNDELCPNFEQRGRCGGIALPPGPPTGDLPEMTAHPDAGAAPAPETDEPDEPAPVEHDGHG